MPSRFQNPHGGGYKRHSMIHKKKNKYEYNWRDDFETKEHYDKHVSWAETHFEIVSNIQGVGNKSRVVQDIHESQGVGGLYELSRKLTNEFQALYKDHFWDGDFFDTIDEFLENRLNENQ